MTSFWDSPATSEPPSHDVLLEAAAYICGERSPDLRDKYRRAAIEARADAFLRTLDEIRHL